MVDEVQAPGVTQLAEFLEDNPRLAVITGAGCSTESGIGDYRDRLGRWKHTQPVQYADFMASEAARRRYWARSLLGWPQFQRARPNEAHQALATLEAADRLAGLITQNVDGLHQRAGHQKVLDLHGRLDRVSCQDCSRVVTRSSLQDRLVAVNGALLPQLEQQRTLEDRQHEESAQNAPDKQGTASVPDGDARLSVIAAEFEVPDCRACGGLLKPDVVFYGESVPKPWVETAYEWVAAADGLLVVGSSLMVFSSFRFCRAAAAAGTPIAIVNQGVTRADGLAALKIEAASGVTLQALLALAGLGPGVTGGPAL